MEIVTTAIVFFILLSVLVLIHEIGHFVAAKRFGIRVDEFGFGLPPRIWGKKIGETVYSVNALPIGGFVKLYGEEGEEDGRKPEAGSRKLEDRAFYSRPSWQRAVVLTAGVGMNFVLALVVLSYLFTQGVFVPAKRVHVEKIVEDSPAKLAGIEINDIIIRFNNTTIENSDQLIAQSKETAGREIEIVLARGADFNKAIRENTCPNCTMLTRTIIPRKDTPSGQGPLGITISHFEERIYPWYQAPFLGLKESIKLTGALLGSLGQMFGKIITLQPVRDVAGPIGIAQVTGEAVKFGRLAVLELLGLLSLNLAIVNILPFPALDGGRLLFVIIEAVFGKRMKSQYERSLHQIGMVILLFLILLVTINDLARILKLPH